MILPQSFYNRDVQMVAKELLGCELVRKTKNGFIKSVITEVEAYEGALDLASHARGGKKTDRNKVMYDKGGVWYVYLVYGMHQMLNVVTGDKDEPQAVLIREVKEANGPAKLTKYFKINKSFNNQLIRQKTGLYIVRGPASNKKIKALKRIGVDYAGPEWAGKLYRYRLEI